MKEFTSTQKQALILQRLFEEKETGSRIVEFTVAGVQKSLTSPPAAQETALVVNYTTLDSPVKFYRTESEILTALKTLVAPEIYESALDNDISSGPYSQKVGMTSYHYAHRANQSGETTFSAITNVAGNSPEIDSFLHGAECLKHDALTDIAMVFVRDGSYKYVEIMVLEKYRALFEKNRQKMIDSLCDEKTAKTGKRGKTTKQANIQAVPNPDEVKTKLQDRYDVIIAYGEVAIGHRPPVSMRVEGMVDGEREPVNPGFFNFLKCEETRDNWGQTESRLVFHFDEKQRFEYMLYTANQTVLLARQKAEGFLRLTRSNEIDPKIAELEKTFTEEKARLVFEFENRPEISREIAANRERKEIEAIFTSLVKSGKTIDEAIEEKNDALVKAEQDFMTAEKALEKAKKALSTAKKDEVKAEKQAALEEKQAEFDKAAIVKKQAEKAYDYHEKAQAIILQPKEEKTAK